MRVSYAIETRSNLLSTTGLMPVGNAVDVVDSSLFVHTGAKDIHSMCGKVCTNYIIVIRQPANLPQRGV